MVSFARSAYAVLGLGRFGSAIANELMSEGVTVVGVDANENAVARHNGRLSQTIVGDTTDPAVLKDLGIGDYDAVAVAIGGSHTENSILTCSLLFDMGVRNLWAKASGDAHARILEQIGVPHIVFPEVDMGRRTAHRLRGTTLDFAELSGETAVVHTLVPASCAGPLNERALWDKHRVKVIATKLTGGWSPVLPGASLVAGEDVQIYGDIVSVEKFARLNAKH